MHLECPTPPAYLPTEDVEGKRALCRKQHFQVEEQDRKFGSHHHQRLRVTYRTASMGGLSVCPVSRRCRVSSAGSRWEIQFAPSTKRACDVQPSQCYGDHTSGCFATVKFKVEQRGGIFGSHRQQSLQVACSTTSIPSTCSIREFWSGRGQFSREAR